MCVLFSCLLYVVFICYVLRVSFERFFLNLPFLHRHTGIDRPSLEWNVVGQYLSLSDYTLMKGWGANVVRLSLKYVCSQIGVMLFTLTHSCIIVRFIG